MSNIKRFSPDFFNFKNEVDNFFQNSFKFLSKDLELDLRSEDLKLKYTPMDLVENEKEYVASLELPGIKKEDISIEVKDNLITISGEIKNNNLKEEDNLRIKERSYGKFIRRFTLNSDILIDKIKASYNDGILKIIIPKNPDTKTKKIKID